MPKYFSQIDANKIPVKGLVPESAASAPSSPVEGQLWYDSINKKTMAYQNGSWVDLSSTAAPSTGTAAQIATGTDTTSQLWRASDLKTAIVANAPVTSVASKTGAVTLVKGDVGLGNVDNTADTAKPVSTAQQTALNLKADLASPALTGVPTAPTASALTSTTQVATTAFVTLAGTAIMNYVDNAVQGLDAKQSVRAATTANITLSGLQTIDGVALSSNDRVLVKDQSTPANNGLYSAQIGGWIRTTDMDAWAEVGGSFVFVEQGTVNADTGWVCTADTITGGPIGTTSITWAQFSSAGVVTASTGLTKVGNDIRVATGGITNAMLFGAIDLASKVTGILPLINGGTGAASASAARVSITAAGSQRITLPALTAGTWTDVPDQLKFVNASIVEPPTVTFVEVSTLEACLLDYRITATPKLQVRADVAVSSGAVYAIVTGASYQGLSN